MPKPKLVLIGSSTGGPGHLEKIISALPSNYQNTIIIAQHMDEMFIPSLVKRFNDKIPITTLIAQDGVSISSSSIIFAQGNLSNLHYSSQGLLSLKNSNISRTYLPSVNCLFESAVKLNDSFDILACLLTGIGDDGAKGIAQLHKAGATCITEDESTCIVYGMPKSAYEIDNTLKQLPLDNIIEKIKNF